MSTITTAREALNGARWSHPTAEAAEPITTGGEVIGWSYAVPGAAPGGGTAYGWVLPAGQLSPALEPYRSDAEEYARRTVSPDVPRGRAQRGRRRPAPEDLAALLSGLDRAMEALSEVDPVAALELATAARGILGAYDLEAATAARIAGSSWARIGEATGSTRQAAQQRYGHRTPPVEQLRREHPAARAVQPATAGGEVIGWTYALPGGLYGWISQSGEELAVALAYDRAEAAADARAILGAATDG